MRTPRLRSLLAAPLVLVVAPVAAAQGGLLRVHFLDVGQGDATLVVGPTGTVLLVDAGDNGQGNAVVVPYALSRGIGVVHRMVASHYHADHIGGLDEVAAALAGPVVAYDRGTANTPSTVSYNDYVAAVAGVRQTIAPGTVIDLGGGATATCVAVNGQILGAGSVPVSGTAQEENSRSVGLLVEYGDFDLWVGGDLTGGGLSTANVESAVAPVVGDIEVLQANHHGSNTSTNAAWVATLDPAVVVFSAGAANPFGHPTTGVVNALNATSRTRLLYCPTAGSGIVGFVNAQGIVVVETDGVTYTVAPASGGTLRLLCDEIAATAPGPGDLRLSEYLANPAAVADEDGEWFEIVNVRPTPRGLGDLEIEGVGSEGFLFGAPVLLGPGERFVFGRHGDPLENGGYVPSTVWPFNGFSLSNSSDTIRLRNAGGLLVDDVVYGAGFPSPNGASVERVNLLGPSGAGSNHLPSTAAFGGGDLGTPLAANSVDATSFPAAIVPALPVAPGGTLVLSLVSLSDAGLLYVCALSGSTTPGIILGSVFVALNPDALLLATVALPGWFGTLQVPGLGSASIAVPPDPGLVGLTVFGAFVTFSTAGGGLSPVRASATAPVPIG